MNSLTLSSPTFDYSALDRAKLQPSTRLKYRRAIDLMIQAEVNPFDYASLSAYADSLSGSSRGFLKAALKVMVAEELTRIKSQATPDNILAIQALIARIEAMDETIKIHVQKGTKAHIWLSKEQVDSLTAIPDKSTLRGMRDYIIIATLLGAGLRREEMSRLTFSSLKRLPYRGSMTDVIELRGKGDVDRVVPISPLLAQHLKEWQITTGGGRVARSVNKAGKIGKSLSVIGIFDIIRHYGAMIGLPELDPHDCRRSFGRLIYDLTLDIVLVRDLLGHASTRTTEVYIGLRLRLDGSMSDYILRPAAPAAFQFMEVSGD